MSLHPTLVRQIHKAFNDHPPEGLDEFLAAVSQTYEGFDEDRMLIERSLDVSSTELGDRIKQLRQAQAQLEAEKLNIEHKVAERTHELVTARAEIEASIRALSFGFALVSPQGEIVFHNQVLEELVGFNIPAQPSKSTFAFRQIIDYFAPAINLLDTIADVTERRARLERQISLGPNFYRLLILPILAEEDGETNALGTVVIVENVTDAVAQERSRDEFFSIASHELRTPLTAIKGNSSMILSYYADAVKDPELHQMVADMHESSVRLIAIVNDFLSASRLEQGKMAFNVVPFDISKLVANVVEEYSRGAQVAGTNLHVAQPVPDAAFAMADADRVRQIIVNLVSNALKFTSKGEVAVSIERLEATIRVRVTDTGAGIPVESQHLLFRKFQQATNNILTRDNTKGTGLGLYISQLMAENMKGRLFLERTELGKGSVFALDLPVAPVPKAVPAPAPESPQKSN